MMLQAYLENLRTQPLSCLHLLSTIGFLFLLKHSLALVNWLFVSFLRPPKNLTTSYGSWALITGSTDGIGKAFAFQLAQKGLNLVLVSRNLEKLKQVSREIQGQYPDTLINNFVLDFSGDHVAAGVRQLEEAIKGLEVGVLINNVGVTYPRAMYFDEVDEEIWMKVVNVNVKGTTLVTRAVIKGMIKRKRGAIVNIGSGASVVVPSHPLYAVYAATKAYIDQLSRSLHVEYKDYGIHVQCQVPLYVWTKMASTVASVEKSSLWIPSADDYAAAAGARIGYEVRCTPYWSHALQWFFASLLPHTLLDAWRLSIGINRQQQDIFIN